MSESSNLPWEELVKLLIGKVTIDNEKCYRLYFNRLTFVRTLHTSLSRSKTHVTVYRGECDRPIPRIGRRKSRDCIFYAPLVVELLQNEAAYNVVLDAILEAHLPEWVRFHVENAARKMVY